MEDCGHGKAGNDTEKVHMKENIISQVHSLGHLVGEHREIQEHEEQCSDEVCPDVACFVVQGKDRLQAVEGRGVDGPIAVENEGTSCPMGHVQATKEPWLITAGSRYTGDRFAAMQGCRIRCFF